jgi:arylsulfatase A-like enzyme
MKQTNKPNVVFILTDDQRFDTINALGGGQVKTPNMDKLVSEGVSFTNATIMGGTQPAVCCPSRNMILTGRGLFETEGVGTYVAPDVQTLPQLLKDNGYRSYHVGKWHQDLDTHKRSFDGGKGMRVGLSFDSRYMQTDYKNHFDTGVHDYSEDGVYDESNFRYEGTPFTSIIPPYERFSENRHSSTVFTDSAIDLINEHTDEKPYFMFLAYTAPHDPRQYPTEYFERYKDVEIELPENYMPQHPFDNGELYVRDELLASHPRLPWDIKEHICDYYGIITHLDDEIGRLMDHLKEKDEWENTIIIFAGDNGLAVGQHGLMGKQSVYEHSIRVPLIMVGPGIPKNKKADTLCYLSDIYPTICDMLDINIPDTVSGKSLKDSFGDDYSLRDRTYHAYMHMHRSLRKRHYKLNLYHVKNKYIVQLFDIKNDPKETNNLAKNDEYRETFIQMFEEIKECQIEYKDYGAQGHDFWAGFKEFISNGDFSIDGSYSPIRGAIGIPNETLCF